MQDEKCDVLASKSSICIYITQGIHSPETDTPRRKKIRRLRFMVDSFGLFVVFVLENSRYSCRGCSCFVFYEMLQVSRRPQTTEVIICMMCVRVQMRTLI